MPNHVSFCIAAPPTKSKEGDEYVPIEKDTNQNGGDATDGNWNDMLMWKHFDFLTITPDSVVVEDYFFIGCKFSIEAMKAFTKISLVILLIVITLLVMMTYQYCLWWPPYAAWFRKPPRLAVIFTIVHGVTVKKQTEAEKDFTGRVVFPSNWVNVKISKMHLIHGGRVAQYDNKIWVHNRSCNNHTLANVELSWCFVAFTAGQFLKKCTWTYSLTCVGKLIL